MQRGSGFIRTVTFPYRRASDVWPAGHTAGNSPLSVGSTSQAPVRVGSRHRRIGVGKAPVGGRYEMAEFVSNYGIWVVAAFIALESVGIPLPAEAALIAAGFFAARTHGLDIWSLIAASI